MTDQPHQQVLDDLHPQYTALRDRIPDVYKGFAQLSKAAFAGNLDRSVKELIAGDRRHARVRRLHRLACPCRVKPAPPNNRPPKRSVSPSSCTAAPTIYGARAYTAFCEFFDADHG